MFHYFGDVQLFITFLANNYYAERGQPIKCGSIIRLMHLTTQCFLHSHNFPAPLSRFHQASTLKNIF